MPRELVTVQVGQCGNQIGCRFWDLALREHAAANPEGLYDEAISSFFRNVDVRSQPPINLPVGNGNQPIQALKARAVVVDMEEGVINNMLKGPLGEVFDNRQMLFDVSGAGNNWAHGFHAYGPQYRDALADRVRVAVEECDSLQGFLLLHSLGGGTGSGLGSYILDLLADEFPEVYRFTTSVFPSEDDDVITSPYNAFLSLSRLVESADCVMPVDNAALMDICGMIDKQASKAPTREGSKLSGDTGKSAKPFDMMNGIAANLLLNLTSSVRFEGSLNVDLNEIIMNMVPFPRMHFLLSGMSPLSISKDINNRRGLQPRALDQVFSDVMSPSHQLIKVDPRPHKYLACALLMRGAVSMADINRNVARIKPGLRMIHWNQEGFKIGMCATPPVGVPVSALGLANNCGIASTFTAMRARFDKLYKRKVYAHHYLEFMPEACFDDAVQTVASLTAEYERLDAMQPPDTVPTLRSRGLSFL